VRKLVFHDLRATFASLLIAHGGDVVFVSRQLGHASPEITLRFYARLFDKARHAEKMSAALEASFGAMLMSSPGLRITPEVGN
jgi:integrase